MSGFLLIVLVAAALAAVEAWEVRRREARKLRRIAKTYLIRSSMELHPSDQEGRVPGGWR